MTKTKVIILVAAILVAVASYFYVTKKEAVTVVSAVDSLKVDTLIVADSVKVLPLPVDVIADTTKTK